MRTIKTTLPKIIIAKIVERPRTPTVGSIVKCDMTRFVGLKSNIRQAEIIEHKTIGANNLYIARITESDKSTFIAGQIKDNILYVNFRSIVWGSPEDIKKPPSGFRFGF